LSRELPMLRKQAILLVGERVEISIRSSFRSGRLVPPLITMKLLLSFIGSNIDFTTTLIFE
jgi:hypothetical protein